MMIKLTKELTASTQYRIDIEYVAPIATNKLDGLYLSKYIDPATGEER